MKTNGTNGHRSDEDDFADRDVDDDEELLASLKVKDRRAAVGSLRGMAARSRFPTPFHSLDIAMGLGGWCGGNVYVLVGGTGAGKTSLALGLSRHHAYEHGPVIYVSEEMEEGHCLARAGGASLGVYPNALITGDHDLTDEDLLEGLPPRFFIQRGQPLEQLRLTAIGIARRFKTPPLIVVDYLGKIVAAMLRRDPKLDPRVATTFASSEIVGISHAVGCPILVVAAGGRGSLMKLRPGPGARPRSVRDLPPSDLVDIAKESGDVEYDATAMLTLSVSEEVDCDGFQVATLTVAKARYGRAQHIKMAYDGPRGQWHDRGRYEPTTAKTDVDPATLTSDRIAKINAIEQQVLGLLAVGPMPLAELAKVIKLARPDVEIAVKKLVTAGLVTRSGTTKASRYGLAETTLPGLESAPGARS